MRITITHAARNAEHRSCAKRLNDSKSSQKRKASQIAIIMKYSKKTKTRCDVRRLEAEFVYLVASVLNAYSDSASNSRAKWRIIDPS